MATATQLHRQLNVHFENLADDSLLLTSFDGEERMSRLYSFNLELISDNESINPRDVIGNRVSFGVLRRDDNHFDRYFHGNVARFSASGRTGSRRRYTAQVVPWMWFMTQGSNCRIFQGMTVPDILDQVFSDYNVPGQSYDFSELKRSYPTLEYCVQYRETDFNFVSRLMEQEGIYYYFRHRKDGHTLILGDTTGGYKWCPEKEVEQEGTATTVTRFDHVLTWTRDFTYIPSSWTQTDYNFIEKPAKDTKTPSSLLLTSENTVVPELTNSKVAKLYDYPGDYLTTSDGKVLTKIRMEEHEAGFDVATGTAQCKTFTAGGKFKLTKHELASEVGRSYVITAIHHQAHEPAAFSTGEAPRSDYQNSFRCIPDNVIFRPERITPKPMIHGTQTAVVTGPPGEEIWPDKYGRVKVQFFWDRKGERDANTSCWIRCSQSIAGKNWGAMVLPRVGQEVVVSYLEGDPDRPLITGTVYNDDQMPPYTLPDEKTKSTFKTSSTPGGKGFNELRFEDKKGKEQIFIHAQRNMDTRVLASSMERIGGNRHLIVGSKQDKTGDQLEQVHGNKHLNVKGDQAEKIEGAYQLSVGLGEGPPADFDLYVENDKREEVNGAASFVVSKDRMESVGGKVSLTCADHHEKVDKTYALEAQQEIHLKSGISVVIEGQTITLKSGGNFISVSPAGVAISGTLVLINSGGAAGSGGGVTPEQPFNANQAQPKEPVHADKAKTGKKSAPDSLN